GYPSGSAMPLVWAHAEYLKLKRSLRNGKVFDMPPQPVQRYQIDKVVSHLTSWRFNHKCRTMEPGRTLRIESLSPTIVHWSDDGWKTVHDSKSRDTGIGIYVVDLNTSELTAERQVDFTFYWPDADSWEQVNYSVCIGGSRL
ncbi:MAG TPA: glucan 1,4-alpha-glucosidase, partial [candidate division Zixibacteria bacterium]|nr:glucan 1,4-alpha-glucosidase [candidate division Zixibacteria bacterium]